MTDYTALPNSAVGIGGIPSGTTVTALRDNPLSIQEGDVTAPRIENHALARTPFYYGTATATVDTVFLTEATNFDDAGVVRYEFMAAEINNDTTTCTVEISVSTNNGSTWGGWSVISPDFASEDVINGCGYVDLVTGDLRGFATNAHAVVVARARSTHSLNLGADINGLRLRFNLGSGNQVQATGLFLPMTGRAVNP